MVGGDTQFGAFIIKEQNNQQVKAPKSPSKNKEQKPKKKPEKKEPEKPKTLDEALAKVSKTCALLILKTWHLLIPFKNFPFH